MSTPASGFPILEKGAFIIYGKTQQMISFQFNPESITRTKTLEGDAGEYENTGSGFDLMTDQHLGETFSIKLMLDSNEYPPLKKDAIFGIIPILAALEEMMEPTESASKKTIPGHKYPPKAFPQVAFYWGENRVLPVKIDGMTITEKRYNNKLVPISAEVEVKMKFLIPELSPDMEDEMKKTYEWTKKQGKLMAKKYYN